jgi:transmembrane sensor
MSFDIDTPKDPQDLAVDWVLRKRESLLTRKEQAAFDAWLAADPVHRGAYREAEELSAELSSLDLPSQAPRAREKEKEPISGGLDLRRRCRSACPLLRRPLHFRSLRPIHGTGEPRRATLEDGSRIELGPRSAIARDFTPSSRRLVLLRGEAWFDVVPDPGRPFAVESAAGSMTALGTSFDIALEQAQARVTVTAHRVRVTSGGKDVMAREGQETSFSHGAPRPRAHARRCRGSPLGGAASSLWRTRRSALPSRRSAATIMALSPACGVKSARGA